MTLRQLWRMSEGKRQRQRRQVLEFCAVFSLDKKADWPAFIDTGQLKTKEQHPLPRTPLVEAELARGRLAKHKQ